MSSRDTSIRTKFQVLDVHHSELSTFLGLAPDAVVVELTTGPNKTWPTNLPRFFSVTVNSLDEAMAIFSKHNFTEFKGRCIRMDLPMGDPLPELTIELATNIPSEIVYRHYKPHGMVLRVLAHTVGHDLSGSTKYVIQFSNKASLQAALSATLKDLRIGRDAVKLICTKNDHVPDYWTSSKGQKKAKGNAIAIPTNVVDRRQSTVIAHVIPSSGQMSDRSGTGRNSSNQSNRRLAAGQRSKIARRISIPEHVLHPGQVVGRVKTPQSAVAFSNWCSTAFISYETLYHLSSKSQSGAVSISTLAWGAQLDISSFRLHYGSTFFPRHSRVGLPVASCLTVEMRQYGDKESAAEVLTIRNNGRLSEASHAMEEGININCLGHILSMKCLESGHLVTSSLSNNEHSLNVWDMSKGREQAMVPVARLNINPKSKLWFDVAGMDICSVDDDGAIQKYDVYNTLSASKHTQTISVDRTTMIDIDKGVSFYCSSIAVSSHDECVLVGSDEFAQIAHWDPRSPKSTVFTTQSCRRFNTTDLTRKSYDPVFGVQWNPSNSNEFLSVHKSAMRVWDVRKMDSDLFSTQHDVARPIRSAKWSPHRTDCIAGLTMDGQIKIWNIRKVDGPADLGTPIMQPDLLFVHQGHELEISDFDWCPYVEDVISTVSPSTLEHDGGIQVWRPRNLHDSNDNGEP